MEKEGRSSSGTSIFPGMEFNLEPGPLKEISPEKIKEEIKRWAKAVVTYARQLSFGSLDKALQTRDSIFKKNTTDYRKI